VAGDDGRFVVAAEEGDPLTIEGRDAEDDRETEEAGGKGDTG
jgi:hypothetical protein